MTAGLSGRRTRDERGAASVASSAAASVATALAVLAVLAVLAAATVAGVGLGGDDTPAAEGSSAPAGAPSGSGTEESDADTERFFPDGQVLTGDRRENANVEIPSADDGWTFAAGIGVGYVSDEGRGSLTTEDPYLYKEGFCTAGGQVNERAAVGFADPDADTSGDDPARRVAQETAELWRQLIFEGRDPSVDLPDIAYSEAQISDGTPAVIAGFDFDVTRGRDRCSPPATAIQFLTFETGDHVAVVVLQRDVARDGSDLRGGLSGAAAEEILTSARIQQED